MSDKIKEMESRLNRLEDKMKVSFFEVEKRFESLRVEEPKFTAMEQRMQELEDLLLILQLEVTKLKDVAGSGFDLGNTQNTPDMYARLRKIEDELESVKRLRTEKHEIATEEEKPSIGGQLDEIEKRLKKLEQSRELPGGRLVDDVKKILHA